MRTLLERDWIRVVGHRDVPGRPATYTTTKNFLDYFNLSHLDELPDLSEVDDLGKVNEELNFSEVVGDINELEIEKGENLTSMTSAAEEALERVNAEAEIIDDNIHALFPLDGNAVDESNDQREYADDEASPFDTVSENTSQSENASPLSDEGSREVGSSLSQDNDYQD